MNELQVFQNQSFGQVRTTIIDGEPWFVAADVCRALEITNSRDALNRLDDDEKGVVSTDISQGRSETLNAVNEPGLYALVLGSRKPEAKAFKRWITHEVIPTIRKTGMYAVPKSLPEALRLAADLAEKIEKQKPLVLFAETCQKSCDTLLVRDFGKVVGIGERRLFQMLRDWGLIYRENGRNIPYQKYVDRGYFEVTELPYTQDGEVHLGLTTRITPEGQRYILSRLERQQKAL